MAVTLYPSVKMLRMTAVNDVAFVGQLVKVRRVRWNAPTTVDHKVVLQDCPSGTTAVEIWWERNCAVAKADIEEKFDVQWTRGIKLTTLGSGTVDVYWE